jgi:hypothetical protein
MFDPTESRSDPRGLGVGSCPDPGGWGPWQDPNRLGFGSMIGPKVGGGVVSRPKGVGGGVQVLPQGGWGMGMSPDSRGLGFGSFRVRTQNGLGWGSSPDPRGLDVRSVSWPKRVGVWVRHVWTQGGWGWVRGRIQKIWVRMFDLIEVRS